MDIGFELLTQNTQQLQVVFPLALLQHVLQKQQLKLIQQQLLGQYAQHALEAEGEEGTVVTVAKPVVPQNGHPLHQRPRLPLELKLLIFKTFLRVSLCLIDDRFWSRPISFGVAKILKEVKREVCVA